MDSRAQYRQIFKEKNWHIQFQINADGQKFDVFGNVLNYYLNIFDGSTVPSVVTVL